MTFQPNTEEIRTLFPRTEQKVQEPTNANIHDIKDEDFDNFDDFVSEMMNSFRFTGFNPEDFRHYLLHRVFVAPKFTKSQAEAAICAIIVLFITRGNKLNTKNAGRMPQAGKDIISRLQETLGTIFKVKYESNELDDTTITPARVAATFPSVTVNLIQQHSTRVVGNAPIGMPKGLASSFAFSVVPASCSNLLEAMGIWRDSFTLIINPKARSAGAQFLAQSSAYNFSRLALDSGFVPDSVRIKTVASVAVQQFSRAISTVEKFLILYWVDLPEFIEAVTRTLSSTTPIAEAQNQLSKMGINSIFIQKLTPRARSTLADLMTALSKSMNAEEKQLVNEVVSRRSIERRFPLDDVVKVGTLGGRDQGRTFESEATARFASTNQPGLSLVPIAQPTSSSIPTAMMTLPVMTQTSGAIAIV